MRSMRRRALAAVAAVGVLALVLGGCSSATPQAEPSALEGRWVLESFGAANGLVPADPEVTTQLTLAAGQATGNGGVNSFTSTYDAPEAGKVAFGPIAATAMAGPQAATDQEAAFLDALDRTATFELNEGKLVLGSSGNDTLVVLAPQ